jgi:hypothetical protein
VLRWWHRRVLARLLPVLIWPRSCGRVAHHRPT